MRLQMPGSGDPVNSRRVERTPVRGLSVSRGGAIDLSIRGMRLVCRRAWRPGVVRPITLRSGSTVITVPARCVWTRREGMLRWVVGISFDLATPEQLRTVGELSLLHAASLDHARRAAA